MKAILAILVSSLLPALAHANCDLNRLEVRSMVARFLKTRTAVDLRKAYWMNSLKSGTYSVFTIQYGTHDSATGKLLVNTHLVSVSCESDGIPFIDSDLSWAIPVGGLPPLN